MSSVDQFASVFSAADKPVYNHANIEFKKILVVTDLEPEPAGQYRQSIHDFLKVVDCNSEADWRVVTGSQFKTVRELIELVKQEAPDFIATFRHLHSAAWRWPHSLGEHLDVLIQVTDAPVMVLPHPGREGLPRHALQDTTHVMAVTDHLSGDDRLVHWAARLTREPGTLILAHVEDERIFDRYLEVISKIPEIDTEIARETIMEQLLREPGEYVASCAEALARERPRITVESSVTVGHRLEHYRGLIEEHQADLLLMNSKDEDQLAMHGMAYPLAVELRFTPLLFL